MVLAPDREPPPGGFPLTAWLGERLKAMPARASTGD
jgi:hypothetical protein